VRKAHVERYNKEVNPSSRNSLMPLPNSMPTWVSQQAQASWFLGRQPLAKLGFASKYVWEQILHEKLSNAPVVKN
jgi:hypothetical protein